MLKVRLQLMGQTHRRCYSVVVIDSRSPRDGCSVEKVGFYDPHSKECKLKIDRINFHVSNGAQLTDKAAWLVMKNNTEIPAPLNQRIEEYKKKRDERILKLQNNSKDSKQKQESQGN